MPGYNTSPKFDLRVNPAYQVDWSHEQSGKKIAATKRRVKFSFGFSNREAIEKGCSGMDCRGEEHEVILVWSLTSGKRLVLADGQEIHFSTGKITENLFETSWTIAGGHNIKLTAYATPPLRSPPGFRQFDLTIDGMSYFNMPKIYQLGGHIKHSESSNIKANTSAPNTHFALRPVDRNPPVERSVATNKRREIAPVRIDTSERVPPPAVTPDYASQPSFQKTFSEAVVSTPTSQLENMVQRATHLVRDEFAPVPPSPPTYSDKSQHILSHYTPAAKNLALTNAPYYANYETNTPSTATLTDVSECDFEESPKTDISPTFKPTMAPISLAEMQEHGPEAADELSRAFKSLVNLDDITFENDAPEDAKMARLIESKKLDSNTSKPVPAAAPQWHLGKNACLEEIQQNKAPKEVPKQEIMRPHAFDPRAAHAGMMVVHGSTPLMTQPHFHAGVHPSPLYCNRAY